MAVWGAEAQNQGQSQNLLKSALCNPERLTKHQVEPQNTSLWVGTVWCSARKHSGSRCREKSCFEIEVWHNTTSPVGRHPAKNTHKM